MRKQYFHRICVTGVGSFPIDMLRTEGAFPDRQEDAGAIERTIMDNDAMNGFANRRVEVKLAKFGSRDWTPNAARWESFSYEVKWHEFSSDGVLIWVSENHPDRRPGKRSTSMQIHGWQGRAT